MKPRVLLADDHTIVAEGLAALLAEDFQLLGCETDARSTVEKTRRLQPDLVILDISMPGGNGLETARAIQASHCGVRVLMLTQHTEWAYVSAAFAAGASGYVVKNAAASQLRTAIRHVLNGRRYISPCLKPHGDDRSLSRYDVVSRSKWTLTRRQVEVVQLIARGMTAKEMAVVMDVSVKTIEYHKSVITEKLQLRTTAELTVFAFQQGLVS